jgi:hypothetical protein
MFSVIVGVAGVIGVVLMGGYGGALLGALAPASDAAAGSKVKHAVKVMASVGEASSATEIRFRDKCVYTFGVCNVILTTYLIGAFPQYVYLWQTPKMFFYIAKRFVAFKAAHEHYLLFDFCYFANGLSLAYCWFLYDSATAFQVLFLVANGPLAWAVLTFNNSMIFHSAPHMASVFIHTSPMILSFCFRWSETPFTVCESWPECDEPATAPLTMLYNAHVLFYLWWAALYYVVVCVVLDDRAKQKANRTLFDFVIDMKGMGRLKGVSKHERVQKLVYMAMHAVFATVTMFMATAYYHSKAAHLAFMISTIAVSAWNASGYYFSVFAKRYEGNLEKRVKK